MESNFIGMRNNVMCLLLLFPTLKKKKIKNLIFLTFLKSDSGAV